MNRLRVQPAQSRPLAGDGFARGSHLFPPFTVLILRDRTCHLLEHLGRIFVNPQDDPIVVPKLRLIRLDLYEPNICGERRRPTEPQRKVQLLPHQNHDVGLRQAIRCLVQPRIVHASRAHHWQRGYARLRRKLHHPLPSAAPPHSRAGQYHRPFSCRDQIENVRHLIRRSCCILRRFRQVRRLPGRLPLQQVLGQTQMHRPRPACLCDLEGSSNVCRNPGRILDQPGGLRHRRGRRNLIDFLKRSCSQLIQRRVTAEDHNWGFGHHRHVERRYRITVAGTRWQECHARVVRQPPHSIRHMYGRRLVTGMNQVDVPSDRRIVHRHNLVPRKREYRPHTLGHQRLDQSNCPGL